MRVPVCVLVSLWLLDPALLVACALCLAVPAVDGKWQAWASWGSCSVTCGAGSQRRERVCSGPFFGGAVCQGPQDEYRQCGTQRCPGEAPPTWAGRWGGLVAIGQARAQLSPTWCVGGSHPVLIVMRAPGALQGSGPSRASCRLSVPLPEPLSWAPWQSPMRSVMRTTLVL